MPSLAPEDATPTTHTDVSSFISTGCGYDAWTGSARRVVHDIFPVAGSLAKGGLRLDRTYSSHNDALQPLPDYVYYAPGERHTAMQLSHTWWMTGQDGLNTSSDRYIVHFPDGRSAGFHRPEDSGLPETAAWRSGLGTKERLFFYHDPPIGGWSQTGTADLYLEDGSIVHFERVTDYIERDYRLPDDPRTEDFLLDAFSVASITDPHGLVTTFEMEQIPGKWEAWEKRLKRVVDPSGAYLEFNYGADFVNAPITTVTASDGQSVTYGGTPNVTYSDGTTANYTYATVTTRPDDAGKTRSYSVLETAQDTRAEGPMQSILYSNNQSPAPKFGGQIDAERHLDGTLVSAFSSDDARTMATDTRGDGPSRTFFMSKNPDQRTPLLRWKKDFNGVPEYFHYDAYNYLYEYIDRRGKKTTYNNEKILGRPLSIIHPDAFDGNGPTTEFYTYSFQNVASTTMPYYVASMTDGNGKVTTYTRDSFNRVTKITYPDTSFENFLYSSDGLGRVIRHRLRNGYYEFADYDTTGKLTTHWAPVLSATNPETQPSTEFTYYTTDVPAWVGRIKKVKDAKGNETTYEYDRHFSTGLPCPGRGLVTKIIYPATATDGGVTSSRSMAYDVYGNKVSETDETGRTTEYEYDDYMRLTRVKLPGRDWTEYDYTLPGQSSPYTHTSKSVAFEVSPSGVQTTRTFDENLRVSTETNAAGSEAAAMISYGYDENGNRTSVTDPRGNASGYSGDFTTVTAYDSRNRKTSVTSPAPLSYKTEWGYDSVGNVTSISHPDTGVEVKTYDAMNQLKTHTIPKDAGTSSTMFFDYHPSGALWKVTDGNNNTTIFDYNANVDGQNVGFDLKSKVTYPDAKTEVFTYDRNKNLLCRKTTAGHYEVMGYDTRNRKTRMGWFTGSTFDTSLLTWANGSYDNLYTYDRAGRLLTANNSISNVTRVYNPATGLLETDSSTFVGSSLPTHTVEYQYRDDGKVTSLQVDPTDPADPFHPSMGYDPMGRLQTLQKGAEYFDYYYDPASNVMQRSNRVSGAGVAYDYDNLSRMTQRDVDLANGTVWSSEAYAFDKMNRLKSVSRAEDGLQDSFTYNLRGELVNAVYGTVGSPTPTPPPTPTPTPTPPPTPTPTPTATPTPTPTAATPTFNPASSGSGGSPPTDLSVTISTVTTGASIRYTTDGSPPTSTTGTIYTVPVIIAKSTSKTLKAVAYKTGYNTSGVASSTFNRITTAATPTFDPASSSGAHPPSSLSVTVSTTSPAAQMRWTNNGSAPTTTNGNFINGSSGTIVVAADTVKTLKAIAYGNGYSVSGTVSALFDRQDHAPFAAAPVFSPPNSSGSAPPSNLVVTISTGSSGAQMRYTKDGSTPTVTPPNGTWVNGTSTTTTILANTSVTLRAIAYGAAYQNSPVTSALFDRVDHTTTCVPPVFSPSGTSGGSNPPAPQQVTLSTTTSGAKISYTQNGSTPTPTNGTIINATSGTTYIGLNAIVTLKAIAFKTGNYDSPMTTGYYDNTSSQGGGDGATRNEGNEGKETKEGSRQTTTEQTTSGRTVDYTLDNCGNRTNVTDAGTNKSYAVNNLNQYTTGHGTAVVNGTSHEISSYGGTSYAYMGDSFLAKASLINGDSYTLYYDALGRCAKRTTMLGGVETTRYYLFDGEHWIVEYDGSTGSIQSNALYGRGIDEVIKRDVKVNGVMQGWYYFPDRNGNISVVTNGQSTVRESYRYDAFGAPTVTVGAGQTAINNRILFTGREWNPAFGFYEYRARAYNPTIGRFMSEDPKGFDAGDYNLYRYVGNDPLNRSDPMGLYAIDPSIPQRLREALMKAQQAKAEQARLARAAINNALAGKKGSRETIGAFQKRFGPLSATRNKMSEIASKLAVAETALRDDGSKGYIIKATSIAGLEANPRFHGDAKATIAVAGVGGKIIQFNLEHSSVGTSGSERTAGDLFHESLHNAGFEDIRRGASTAYSNSGLQGDRDVFDKLPFDGSGDALRNVDSVKAFADSPQ